ncbi:MAG TPA: hypothetical protein VGJ83_05810 [Gemmatimonadales bacterium]|jgi:hypothetical protein
MADESNVLPPSRVVRWMLLGGAILLAVGLYFRAGLNVPPVSAPAAAVEPPPSPITR